LFFKVDDGVNTIVPLPDGPVQPLVGAAAGRRGTGERAARTRVDVAGERSGQRTAAQDFAREFHVGDGPACDLGLSESRGELLADAQVHRADGEDAVATGLLVHEAVDMEPRLAVRGNEVEQERIVRARYEAEIGEIDAAAVELEHVAAARLQ
jgi:hypothetical protein